jgi:hypothetical protein
MTFDIEAICEGPESAGGVSLLKLYWSLDVTVMIYVLDLEAVVVSY